MLAAAGGVCDRVGTSAIFRMSVPFVRGFESSLRDFLALFLFFTSDPDQRLPISICITKLRPVGQLVEMNGLLLRSAPQKSLPESL